MAAPPSGTVLLEPLSFGGFDEFGVPLECLKPAVFPRSPTPGDPDLPDGIGLDESNVTGWLASSGSLDTLGHMRAPLSATRLAEMSTTEGSDEFQFSPGRSTDAAVIEWPTADGAEAEVTAAVGSSGEVVLRDPSHDSATIGSR